MALIRRLVPLASESIQLKQCKYIWGPISVNYCLGELVQAERAENSSSLSRLHSLRLLRL